MSFEQNYGNYFQPFEQEDYELIPPTEEEINQMYIEQYLEDKEAELEEIKEADKRRID